MPDVNSEPSVYVRLIELCLTAMRAKIQADLSSLKSVSSQIERHTEGTTLEELVAQRAHAADLLVKEIDHLLETNAEFQKFLSKLRTRAMSLSNAEHKRQ